MRFTQRHVEAHWLWLQDLTRDVVRIDAIDAKSLDTIRVSSHPSSAWHFTVICTSAQFILPFMWICII